MVTFEDSTVVSCNTRLLRERFQSNNISKEMTNVSSIHISARSIFNLTGDAGSAAIKEVTCLEFPYRCGDQAIYKYYAYMLTI
jgi:hypothetical protein